MPSTFPLDIVTPERTVLSEEVIYAQLPSVEGSLGILAGHAPLIAVLGVGECVVKLPSGAEEQFALSGGFVTVARDKVTVLADSADRASEIDIDRAEAALAKAREMLGNVENLSQDERENANTAMRRAQVQLRIARGGQG